MDIRTEHGLATLQHGRGRYLNQTALFELGLVGQRDRIGPTIGYVNGKRRFIDEYGQPRMADARIPVRYSGDQHLALIAKTRSGKGRDILIPSLLTDPSSYVVIDPKGQLAAVTYAQREKMMPGRVFVLDPYGLCAEAPWRMPQHAYNPLSSIPYKIGQRQKADGTQVDVINPRFFSDILALAASQIPGAEDDGSNAKHFMNSARGVIAAMMLGLKVNERTADYPGGEDATLPRMREILSLSRTRVRKDEPSDMDVELALIAQSYGPARELIQGLIGNSTDEASSVFTTAQQETIYLSDPVFHDCLSRSDFDFRSMKDEPATVYIILPDNVLGGPQVNWMRLVITAALRELTGPVGDGGPVTFVLDEFYSLSAGGTLAEVSAAMGRAAGSGIRLWPIFQDINQIEQRFGKVWQTFLANCGVVQIFTPGPTDTHTIKHFCEASGSMTVGQLNHSANSGLNRGYSSGRSSGTDGQGHSTSGSNWSSSGGANMGDAIATAWGTRPILHADDLRGLPMDESILFIQGCAYPGRIKRAHYDEDPQLMALASADPYHMPKGWKLAQQRAAASLGYDALDDQDDITKPLMVGRDMAGGVSDA